MCWVINFTLEFQVWIDQAFYAAERGSRSTWYIIQSSASRRSFTVQVFLLWFPLLGMWS